MEVKHFSLKNVAIERPNKKTHFDATFNEDFILEEDQEKDLGSHKTTATHAKEKEETPKFDKAINKQ